MTRNSRYKKATWVIFYDSHQLRRPEWQASVPSPTILAHVAVTLHENFGLHKLFFPKTLYEINGQEAFVTLVE